MAEFVVRNLWLIPALPLLGGLLAMLLGRQLGERSHLPVVIGIAIAFVLSLGLLGLEKPATTVVYDWISIAAPGQDGGISLSVPIELRADGLTIIMLTMVTFVATLVALFASGYMHGDPAYPRFFFVFGLFVFSMTGLVLSSNFVLTYAFWEGVGVCSYLLIGFWHSRPSAAEAAKKAFLVNRVGDFGFAVALFMIWNTVGSLSYDTVLTEQSLHALPTGLKVTIALLLFWGATAKSAQIPLYVWLPDAMEGPTPVSALIHAATMVTAGVYLVARASLLFVQVPEVQLVVAAIGCATALLAALIALTQTDLKRILAYSTVSQIGFMFMGLGAGVGNLAAFAVTAGIFHLFTHAFFKALLFLGSGSVMHAMGDVIDMRRFRGLRHRLPYTFATFAVGALTLAGLPPFAGFWSKDEILSSLKQAGAASAGSFGLAYTLIYWVAILTAFLTAFYTGRAFFWTFFGPEKLPSPDDPEVATPAPVLTHASLGIDTPAPESKQLQQYREATGIAGQHPPTTHGHDSHSHDHGHGHGHGHDAHDGHGSHFGHESGPIMTIPLMILAGAAVVVGLLYGPITGSFAHRLETAPIFEHHEGAHHEHAFDWATASISTIVALVGLGLAWSLYGSPSPVPAKLASTLRPLYNASYRKFGIDEFYTALIVAPTRGLASISRLFDTYVVDGLVRLTAWLPSLVGKNFLAPFQNGLVQYYAAITAFGLAFLLVVLILV